MRSSKWQSVKQLTSTIMAIVITATTTFQMPTILMASEVVAEEEEASLAIEHQIGEETNESLSESLSEETTQVQTNVEDETQDTVDKTTDEIPIETTLEESYTKDDNEDETFSFSSEIDSSENDVEEPSANETCNYEKNPFEALDVSTGFTEESLAQIDFSSKRLLVSTDPSVIIDLEHVLSSYAGVYLMQYDTETQAKYAYAYYYGKSEFVDVDTVISIADGNSSANADTPMIAEENPIAELQAAVAENPVKATEAVAVIDTGVNGIGNVIESISIIGDNPTDENGHGTKMAKLIAEQNPNVSILSIKALGADGTGDVSAVYAAIRYAIDKQVSVINLSMSAVSTAENAALRSIINEATAAGIAVIGAAGNNGKDARFYIPGNIESAYIIGASNKDGERLENSNYGSTVDFNVFADSTSEATAKFSGYYTLNGAVIDEKLVFPTDYKKPKVDVDYNGPIINHQISFYNYQGSQNDLVWISQKQMKTVLNNDSITTYIGFVEDAEKIHDLNIYVDFMSIDSERAITDECEIDLENMTVKIPASYKDSNLTVRWFMPNASYQYCYDTDQKYIVSNTPETFKVASNNAVASLDFATATLYVNGTYTSAYTHTSDSMNHSYVSYSTDGINVGDYFTIQNGYIATVEEHPNETTTHAEVAAAFGANALKNNAGIIITKAFLTHFITVTRDSDGADVSNWFNTVGGKGNGIVRADTDNAIKKDLNGNDIYWNGQPVYATEEVSAKLGWVFGTCANDEVGGAIPFFEPGGKIICTRKDADGTAYFFYYCRSIRAQWSGGSFSITPVLPKTGYLQIHKTSAIPEMTNNNNCYNFDIIDYSIFSDEACTMEAARVNLDANGYSNIVELPIGTYYVRETTNTEGSGYYSDGKSYPITITTEATAKLPVMAEVVDVPMNDPFGIRINKINGDGTTTADLSGAEYEINYYAGKYTTVAALPKKATYTWRIVTKKNSSGTYTARLDDEHVISGTSVYGKNDLGYYMIPLGTITVEEKVAPVGFTVEGATVSSAKDGCILSGTNGIYLFNLLNDKSSVSLKSGNTLDTSIENETAVTLTYAEVQNRAGIQIQKYDANTKGAAPAGLNLEGIKFAIINSTGGDITNYAGKTIADGKVTQVITTDAKGYAATGATDLPIGTYTVRELRQDASFDGQNFKEGSFNKANDSYEWKEQSKTVTLTDADTGKLVYAETFYDSPLRSSGDFKLVKKNGETGETLANIPFKVTNVETGETHYILTDANGSFDSSINKTVNTNANDATLSKYDEKDIVLQSVIESLVKNAGLWFTNNAMSASDSFGALPLGKYTLTELKTESTKSMKMYSSEFTIDADKKTIDLGIINNIAMSIGTTLVTVNNDHAAEAAKSVILTDHVAYTNLDATKKYTLTGILSVKDGDALTVLKTETVEFTPTKGKGTQDVIFTIDASNLAGKSVVAFEELTVDGEFCAEHKDKDDANQTVFFPGIKTTALDTETEDHVSRADDSISIIDTVSYTGLEAGKTYTVIGKLMDKATKKAILDDDENEITASKEFTAAKSNGTVNITFTFAGVSLSGKTVVAFEEIYHEKVRYGVHADITDEDQSVYFPSIKTMALDQTTGINHIESSKKATLVDTVSYTDLLPGREYTVTGKLINKATEEAILINGKEVTASTTFTPSESKGSVKVVFEFDSSAVAPKTVVVFENLTYKGIEIATHAEITDKDQTVYVPTIKTTAISDDTKDHVTKADSKITLTDTVEYHGLEIGREYTMTGTLMNRATGKAIENAGKPVTGTATFTAEKADGTVNVTFKFDGTGLEDTITVVFERLYAEGKEVAAHTDISDENQSIYLPKIRTKAADAITKINHTEIKPKEPKAKIIDTVSYFSLLPGKEYTVSGTLMNKATGEAVLIDDKPITASTIFTPTKAEGSIDIVFEFDANAIAGTTVVAFEKIEYKGIEVGVHADLTDEDQTIYIPDIHTTATATDTKDHITGANEEVTITDEVVLTGLKVGNEYTVSGILMDKTTGDELKVNNESVIAEKIFTADKTDIAITLTYTLDASKLAGTTTVVFETLYTEDKEVGRHHDLTDDGQTVYIPKIHTTAADQKTEINHTKSEEIATIVDTVHYSHLLPGKEYTVKGTLMNKETGEAVLIDGKEITAETTFTAEKSDGSVDVIFTFDSSKVAPTTIVAFETIEYKGIQIGVHADIEDKNQTVYIPEIKTTAIAEDTGDHIEKAKEDAVIVDTVEYKGLEIGREYVMTGKLVDKKTGEAITDAEGNEITASEIFTAEATDGSVDITFKFDTSALAGKSLVAFETLTSEGKEVAVHADLTDEGQTVHIPEIHTTATDKVTGDHDGIVAKEITVLDEVFYKNLIPGKEYTVKGTLMVKETGEPLTIDGKGVTAEKTFTAEEENGSIILEFTFDSSALAGKHIVAFEDVEYKGISIGSHEDLEDEDQTISYPEIYTNAADQAGSKTMVLGTNATLVDTVSYKGLTIGKTYVVKGTIMDQTSGEAIGITAKTTFTTEAADGSTTVVFTFDTGLLQGKTLVVFETLYDEKGNQIVDHKDLNDADQTVTVPVKPQNPPVVTGDDSTPMPYVAGFFAAMLAIVAVVAVLVKRRKKQA